MAACPLSDLISAAVAGARQGWRRPACCQGFELIYRSRDKVTCSTRYFHTALRVNLPKPDCNTRPTAGRLICICGGPMRAASVYSGFHDLLAFALVAGALACSFSMTGCGGSRATPPPPPVLTIPSATVSDGTIGAAYTQTIQAAGGVAPFNWTVSAGLLPHGLSLESSSSNWASCPAKSSMSHRCCSS